MKNTIKILSISLLLALLLSLSAFAKAVDTVTPLWNNVANAEVNITFDGTVATVRATATGNSDVTYMDYLLDVQEYVDGVWRSLTYDIGDVNGRNLVITLEFEAVKGREYWVQFAFHAQDATDNETVVVDKKVTC